ncbi:BgTH12-02840 [Blumeria graminis f. sp. triticale]|uniref:Bgt-4198 n=3 Tax=Blumeria graminis TaxID=34373 RepID=A0A9X9MID5_BLUGR|nr:hypothetical protein BGT96224_4198 [Blumeria graminis f. sp. tritici 96224]CAD6503172.1 BgTH12-02840 [Blumeria graminis f. sp. triticale]VDB89150.1 Bgt-4198 [Blumeria graminis f. sp. tritici]
MELLAIQSLADCASFDKTVHPNLPQLYELPRQILQSPKSLTALKEIYQNSNPFVTALAFSLILAPIFLIVSEINKNYSQVDRLWSILPSIYNIHYVVYARISGLETERLDHLLAFSIAWSLRLTFNYYRKGGYNRGSEDYRWAIIRKRLGPSLFFLLNILFISLAQSLLLLLLTTPAYIMLVSSQFMGKMSLADYMFTHTLVGLVIIEFLADQQQWDFQEAKKLYLNSAQRPDQYKPENLERGFVVTGLWSWSRHPNFAAEQAIWIIVYLWGCWTTRTLYNWTLIGAASYIALFQASTWLTELSSAQKYPEYALYRKNVGKFVPRLNQIVTKISGSRPPNTGKESKII